MAAASILGFLLLFSAPLGAQVETQPESRPKPVITPIQVPNLSLGVVIFPNGKAINLSVGTGSSAYRNPNDLPGRIWLLTDRGPNIECGEARRILGLEGDQACAGNRMGRIFPLPCFVPSIYAADIGPDNTARFSVYLPLKGKSGKPLSGRPPQVNGRYESAYAIDGKPLPPDPSGVDPEGLVRVSDGTFWIADELGPSLLQVASDGTVLKRLVPQGLQNDFKDADYEVVPSLPPILRYRALNRGFEALALSPDEKFLYAMLQGPLANPDIETARRSRHVRLWKIARETGEVVGEYFYQTDDINSYTGEVDGRERVQSRVLLSEMAAIAEDQLLVLERVDRHARFYTVQLTDENRVPRLLDNPEYGPGFEWMDAAQLALRGVLPLTKTLVLDSEMTPGLPAKIEGLAITGPNEFIVINDNDFGVDGVRTQMFRVTLPQPLIR
ncbi:MAG: esterase-like activity of phytase family protein [Methylobacterium sp.]